MAEKELWRYGGDAIVRGVVVLVGRGVESEVVASLCSRQGT